jgi:hypothetical protein
MHGADFFNGKSAGVFENIMPATLARTLLAAGENAQDNIDKSADFPSKTPLA